MASYQRYSRGNAPFSPSKTTYPIENHRVKKKIRNCYALWRDIANAGCQWKAPDFQTTHTPGLFQASPAVPRPRLSDGDPGCSTRLQSLGSGAPSKFELERDAERAKAGCWSMVSDFCLPRPGVSFHRPGSPGASWGPRRKGAERRSE